MSNSKDYRLTIANGIASSKSKTHRKIAHATYFIESENLFGEKIFGIQYHNTVIAGIFDDGSYSLNNGGFFSVTTKKRLNSFLREIGSDSYIYQRNFTWYLDNDVFLGSAKFDVNHSLIGSDKMDVFSFPSIAVKNLNAKILAEHKAIQQANLERKMRDY